MTEAGGTADGPADGWGLYVHFPFCAHVCHYCDYAVEAAVRPPVAEWLRAVDREIALRLRADEVGEPPRLATIYVGGGTPSLLGRAGMEELGGILGRRFRLDGPELEWTVEANPASLDPRTAAAWRASGVSRVSLGVQSFDDRALRWLGRLHDSADALRAVEAVRASGLSGLSVDLLYGLPDGVDRDWAADIARVVERGIPHLSLYGLSVEGGTPLGRWVAAGRVEAAAEDRVAEQYLRASRRLEEAGWEHYELGSLARPGHRSRHGGQTWSGGPILGIGPSAHGHLPPRRYRNVAQWPEYRTSVGEGALPEVHREELPEADRRAERIWLRLRTREGVGGELARTLRRVAPDLIGRLETEGWLRAGGPEIAPTPEGWLRLDDMADALASALAGGGPARPGAPDGGRPARPGAPGGGVAAHSLEN